VKEEREKRGKKWREREKKRERECHKMFKDKKG
jgi:hypothetical protein